MADFVIGVDVGGTNTDTAILHKSSVIGSAKCSTTLDTTAGVFNSIKAALGSLPSDLLSQLQSSTSLRVAIGTTHFVNAVVQRDQKSLSKVAVLRLCGSSTQSLPPFVDFPQDLARIISGGHYLLQGGMEYNTTEIAGINEAEVRECVRDCLAKGVRDFVVCGVFSPCADPDNNQESKAAALLTDECQKQGIEPSYTLSHKLAMLGLLERENAAILNQSLKKLAAFTIGALLEALSKLKLCSDHFYLTQNDGTLISASEASSYPVLTFSSGPTNSMRGAAYLTRSLNAIVVDIGGTTTDVGVIDNGFPRQASTYCEIGGVKTNFPMPDVRSIGVGGGSLVTMDAATGRVEIGPGSVGYEITSRALCFGGRECTATDIAIASNLAPGNFATHPGNLSDLDSGLVSRGIAEIRRKVEDVIDTMKTDAGGAAVILVGGGSIILDKNVPLRGVATLQCPGEHSGVANAIGAALGTVGGDSDRIVDLGPIRTALMEVDPSIDEKLANKMARELALEAGKELAKEEVIRKGGLAENVYIHSQEVTDVTYVPDRVRVRVKAIANLCQGVSGQERNIKSTSPTSQSGIDTSSGAGTQHAKYTGQTAPVVTDNQLWPFSSQQHIDDDKQAGLPSLCVDKEAGVWTLSEHDVECLATGAAILGCGGGGSPYTGQLRAIQLIRAGKCIKIKNPFRVKEEERGLVCGVAFMGAPAILIEKLPSGTETQLALTALRRVLASGGLAAEETKYDIPEYKINFTASIAKNESLDKIDLDAVPKEKCVVGLYCMEAGGFNSIEPLLAGALEDLPVLDADGMGRAFPELQMFIPFINGCKHTPSALADNKEEAIACLHTASSKDLENFFRIETIRMGLSAAIASGVMSYEELMSNAVLLSMSQAWQLGRAVLRARANHSDVVQAVVNNQHGLVLLVGKVVRVQRETSQGFSTVEAIVEGLGDSSGRQLRVLAKNENYIAQQLVDGAPGKVLACTPDLITIIDSDTGDAVTTELIRYGLRVGVVVLPANHMLKTSQAMKVVGPSAFGFDIPYQEPVPMD